MASAAPSIDASPVVSVAGSVTEATVTVTPESVEAIGAAVAAALPTAPEIATVALGSEYDAVRDGVAWFVLVGAFWLAYVAGLLTARG